MLHSDRSKPNDRPPRPSLQDIIPVLINRIDRLLDSLDAFQPLTPGHEPVVPERPGQFNHGGASPGLPAGRKMSTMSSSPTGLGDTTPLPDCRRIPPEGEQSRSPFLDSDGAAAYLGITLKSLYGVVERGHLRPWRGPRRRYRFTEAMLDDYLARGAKP